MTDLGAAEIVAVKHAIVNANGAAHRAAQAQIEQVLPLPDSPEFRIAAAAGIIDVPESVRQIPLNLRLKIVRKGNSEGGVADPAVAIDDGRQADSQPEHPLAGNSILLQQVAQRAVQHLQIGLFRCKRMHDLFEIHDVSAQIHDHDGNDGVGNINAAAHKSARVAGKRLGASAAVGFLKSAFQN